MIPKFRGLSIDKTARRMAIWPSDRRQRTVIHYQRSGEANEQYITIGSWCPVNIESVGRFTGMFDKNYGRYMRKIFWAQKMVC